MNHTEAIRILIFCIGDIRMGTDMAYISEIRRSDQVGRQELDEIFRLDEKLSFPHPPAYQSPMILCIRHGERKIGVMVDRIQEIDMPIFIEEIRMLPLLIQASTPSSPIWAAVVKDREIILLFDPVRLAE
jgi:chemotaxis signal transduction protein